MKIFATDDLNSILFGASMNKVFHFEFESICNLLKSLSIGPNPFRNEILNEVITTLLQHHDINYKSGQIQKVVTGQIYYSSPRQINYDKEHQIKLT